MTDNWDNSNIYNYKKLNFTPFKKAVGYYICKIRGVPPMRPILSTAGSWYYRQWEYEIIHGGAKEFIKWFNQNGFAFSGEVI